MMRFYPSPSVECLDSGEERLALRSHRRTFPAAKKTLPCKFLYDEEGSRLFNEICELEEYYPTRTENQILCDNIGEIATLIGSECRLVEFGSGSSTKTRHLLHHLPSMSGYVPIDISGTQLLESAARLAGEFPGLPRDLPVGSRLWRDFQNS